MTATTRHAETSRPTLVYSRARELRQASDKELLWAIRDDDETALDELIERKTEPLLKLACRILNDSEEARDIVQMTFLRLWLHRDRFDERWAPNTWIYRIATNLAIDHLRSRRSRQRTAEPMRLHLEDSFDDRARHQRAQLHEGEVMAIFHELAAELTDKQRMVFLLREVEGLASKEVADIVGCRESTVRNHLFNARKILRREILARYPEYVPPRVRAEAGGAS
jgi:RNA polymerase sigma-70 factor (ECF subfamily)